MKEKVPLKEGGKRIRKTRKMKNHRRSLKTRK